jgi:hypothetical protein
VKARAKLSADGKLLGHSECDCDQSGGNRNDCRAQSGNPALDLQLDEHRWPVNPSGTSASVVATNADAGSTITVTGTATGDHGLSANCTASITVPAVEKLKEVEDWGECTFEKNPKKPWRVDNDCKDVLDKLALRIQQMPNGKVAIVGYNDQTEVVNAEQIGARAVNIKYYMTTDELGPKVDPTRLEPRKGGAKGKAAHFYFVPQGQTFTTEESVKVDETAVQGQSRNAAPPAKKSKKTAPQPPE